MSNSLKVEDHVFYFLFFRSGSRGYSLSLSYLSVMHHSRQLPPPPQDTQPHKDKEQGHQIGKNSTLRFFHAFFDVGGTSMFELDLPSSSSCAAFAPAATRYSHTFAARLHDSSSSRLRLSSPLLQYPRTCSRTSGCFRKSTAISLSVRSASAPAAHCSGGQQRRAADARTEVASEGARE